MSLDDGHGNFTLHGNLRLGSTQSGRLSSSEPNLQNLPSGSSYGKAIKNCFVAPKGWLWASADFSALEDRIGAILSKDVNKTKEFLEGYDGHSLRCFAFFPEELQNIGLDLDPTDPNSINRIQTEAKELRNKSKPISFLKQYGGGASKIQKVLKCTPSRANEISNSYDNLYSGLLDFQNSNEQFAKKAGYVELAFGLKLQTPRINSKDSGLQSAEVRSSSNAVTQSWGQLMNRASIDIDNRIENSEFVNDVKSINNIHDAWYGLVRDTPECIKWLNDNLIECMQWQEDPLLHSDIKLGAELDIGYDWAHCNTLKNNASLEEIEDFLKEL
jgi:DNA polymerase-1